MTPSARASAAIAILNQILTGAPAEQALTGWARKSRYAGSKDRAAVRDLVFAVLRGKTRYAALGGGTDGRALVLGNLRDQGIDPAQLFDGTGYGPSPLRTEEIAGGRAPKSGAEETSFPEWLWPGLVEQYGAMRAETIAGSLLHRSAIHLRVNTTKCDRSKAIAELAKDAVEAKPHALSKTALEVTEGARKVAQSAAYRDGLVELQDAASQAIIDTLELQQGQRVLDYCAGGGGKTLAMAAQVGCAIYAHDVKQQRMKDLPARADRAGAVVKQLSDAECTAKAPFDLVLCDVPCSGSGAWRRAPEGKWALTPKRLEELPQIQGDILSRCADLLGSGGTLAYATCSVFAVENQGVVAAFLKAHPDFEVLQEQCWLPDDGADGFFLCVLKKK